MTSENNPGGEDAAKVLLRLAVGGLMLFHGVQKIRHGVDWMYPLLEAKGLPTFIAYGSYFGEVAAPHSYPCGRVDPIGVARSGWHDGHGGVPGVLKPSVHPE